MKRRTFITGLAGVMPLPFVARAQQPGRKKRIGILVGLPETDPDVPPRIAALREGLRKLGWSESQNIQLDLRWAPGDAAGARALAEELISLKPDLVIAHSSYIAVQFQKITTSIPIIFIQVTDPVASKLVASFAHPGANITGFTNYEASLTGKWIELLREIEPKIERVGVVFNPETVPVSGIYLEPLKYIGPKFGINIVPEPFRSVSELDPIVLSYEGRLKGGLLVLPDVATSKNRRTIIEAAARHRVPTIYGYAHFPKDGGLMSYGIDPVDLFAKSAIYADRVLRGEKPGGLPVQAPTQFQLVINRTTATSLALTIPQSLLAQADEIIE